MLATDQRNGPTQVSSAISVGGLSIRTIEYVEVRSPAWAPDSWRMDVQHHLVVVATKGDTAAVCASQPGLLDKISKVGCASLFDRSVLEAAFVGRKASVIWMSGIHAKTDSKPMAKTLMGSALEYAIDPLGDQSFFYSAMRSRVDVQLDGTKDASIGTSPSGSRIWVSRPPDWQRFATRLEIILDRVGRPPLRSGRFDMLATSLHDLKDVKNAYEVGFVPPELFSDLDALGAEEIESWAFETDFEVIWKYGADVVIKVARKGVDFGDVSLSPSISGERVIVSAAWTNVRGGTAHERTKCLDYLREGKWTKIRYESGHTIEHGGCFSSALRDQLFDWRFMNLTGYDVAKEKPAVPTGQTLASIIGSKTPGSIDDSLFGYVFDQMSAEGWLASDDGSMEIADFIHIADNNQVTLFHVKAAGSTQADRQTSASKYEVVVGQAIKNLRHLDRTKLATALTRNQGNQIGSAVWHAGVWQKGRAGLIRRASLLPPGYPRKVVILQPQLTRKEHDDCNAGETTRDRQLRMKQLHTLMLAARLSAGAVGASLEGWAAA